MRRIGAELLVLVLLAGAAPALAQGPTTGSINGTVTDNTNAVLPGVTVTTTSPAMMGSQVAVTNEQGQYRFPSLPPGTYTLTFEIAGFGRVVREGIVVSIGFTATVNVQLQLAGLQETVTVSGQSPVVDVQNTNAQFNFTTEMLQNIPNARDIWALIGEAPGMMVTRFDVGGSRAGTQTGYSAFGYSGQNRVQVDGVNTTEGTSAAGFYYDYGSFEEIQLGTDGNDASAPTPGTQLNAVIKSGGNTFRGNFYLDFENESMQGRNVDDRLRRLGIGEGSRVTRYFDPNGDIGGPIKRDKFWYFTSWRNQRIGTTVGGFPVEAPSDFEFLTRLQNGTYKLTYQLSPNNKIGHYVQLGRKLQPHRGAGSTAYFDSVFKQDSMSYAGNVDWNSIVSPSFFFNARVSTFGYNWPNLPYGVDGSLNQNLAVRRSDNGSGNTAGASSPTRNDRRRIQFDWTATYFKDSFLGGDHALKMGVVSEREGQIFKDEGFLGGISLTYSSGSAPDFTRPLRVTIRNTPRLTENWNWHHGAFVTDQWSLGRVTMTLGLRWDSYSSDFPDEEILPGPWRDFFYTGAPLPNGYSIPATPFAGTFKVPGQDGLREFPRSFAPRLGVSWDLVGDGRTVLKGNWGRFYQNTGIASGVVNPTQAIAYTFGWNDRNGDRRFQTNEFGNFSSSSGGWDNLIDPNLKHPYTESSSIWLERQLLPNVGARVGYTFRKDHDPSFSVQLNRVAALYTLRREFPDPGIDGIVGTGDDGPTIVAWDIPAAVRPPSRTITATVDGPFQIDRAFNVTLSKRMADRWSMTADYVFNWDHDRGFVQNPNQERFNERTITAWAFKVFGTYQAPGGFVVSPVLRHQSGDARSRVVQVNLGVGTLSYEAEGPGSYREDNIWLFDTRFEKRFNLDARRTLALFLDAYNIANSNAAETQDGVVGRRTTTVDGERISYQRFLRPTVVLSPRIFKIGFRLLF
ncbi:MAG: TonB-dependent receptor [Acidobacteria bacterium]|nr:TonB-dependent receptor [Acidobacteriota bacterium]